MGRTPIAPPRLPTALERLRAAYVKGRIDVEAFEERVEYLLEQRLEDERTPVAYEAPSKPNDDRSRWIADFQTFPAPEPRIVVEPGWRLA